MIDIEFKVDEDILARAIIRKSCMPKDFADYLWDKYKPSYKALKEYLNETDINESIIKEVKEQSFFCERLNGSRENLKRVQSCWENNKDKINKFLKSIMKVDIDLKVVGYIVDHKIGIGTNLRNNDFVWGHGLGVENFNYDLIYMTHEALHSFFDRDDISHVIIQYITDIELCKFLNNTNEGYPTHSYLKDITERLYPYWNLYLNKSKEEISKDQEISKIYYNIEDFEEYRDEISNINIIEFIEFAKTKEFENMI
jgi:hypothetical protein